VEAARKEADALAHYLWPPQWVDAAPPGTITNAVSPSQVESERLADVVFESALPGDLEMKVCRDGMIVWNCAKWGEKPNKSISEPGNVDPGPEIKYQTRCLRLMNVHLACLLQSSGDQLSRPLVLSPSHFLKVRFRDTRVYRGSSTEPSGIWLARARNETLSESDFRRLRWQPVISLQSLKEADDLLRKLLELESSEMALFRADSIYRSVVAYRDFDHGAALVNAWVAIEGLIGDLFARYLEEEKARPAESGSFIDSKRRAFLEGSSVSSRITAEILSLVDRLPHRLYREIRECAKARNSWMHSAAPDAMGEGHAILAIRVAGEMFRLVEGVDLRLPIGRSLMSLG
jgi:hypothetical protein